MIDANPLTVSAEMSLEMSSETSSETSSEMSAAILPPVSPPISPDRAPPTTVACVRCHRELESGFLLGAGDGGETPRWKCLPCSLIDAPLVRRSARVAIVVGSILVALNHGDHLLAGTFSFAMTWWKLPLTYLVPFCVSTYGALSNGYRPTLPSALE